MMNGRFSEVAGKLNLVFKVNDKGHNIVCIPFGNKDCKPRANERYATKAEAGEGFKNLAIDVMPIPEGKGFQVVARKTGQVIGNFKDAKSARKAIEDAKIRNNNQIDDDLGNKPSGRPEYNPNSEYNGGLVRVPKPDPDADADADALADRIGGQSRVKFANSQREFDVVSDKYVGQAKPANYNFNKTGRDQAKATFDAARDNGKKVYYHFDGPPHKDTIRTLERYSKEYNIPVVIDTKPF